MFLPISTDHHDSKIGIVSLSIIVICFVVQLVIHFDTIKTEEKIAGVIAAWEMMNTTDSLTSEASDQVAELAQSVLAAESLANSDGNGATYGEMTAAFIANDSKRKKELALAIDSVNQTSLMYRGALVKNHLSFFDLFSHMFIHAGWLHLLGNLWFFYITGIMMERYWGIKKFAFFYLFIGVFSGLGFIVISELQGANVASTPLVGASGAMAGMMGALWAVGKRIKVKIAYFVGFRWGIFDMTMGWYLGLYFVGQLIYGLLIGKYSGVAYMAHVAGFALGVIFGFLIQGEKFESEPEPAIYVPTSTDISSLPQVAGELLHPHTGATRAAERKRDFLSDGWNSYDSKDFIAASADLAEGVSIYMLDTVRFATEIAQQIEKIYWKSKELSISPEQYYQWAMHCDMHDQKKPAMQCYELAAQFTKDNLEFRLKSLLKSAELRIALQEDIARAQKFLTYVYQSDREGRFGHEAAQLLQQIRSSGQA